MGNAGHVGIKSCIFQLSNSNPNMTDGTDKTLFLIMKVR